MTTTYDDGSDHDTAKIPQFRHVCILACYVGATLAEQSHELLFGDLMITLETLLMLECRFSDAVKEDVVNCFAKSGLLGEPEAVIVERIGGLEFRLG